MREERASPREKQEKKENSKEGLAAHLQKLIALDASVDDFGSCFCVASFDTGGLVRDCYKQSGTYHSESREVSKMQDDLIITDPNAMMGKPLIAGTRITVELILDKLAVGETIEQILNDYPQLSREAVLAVISGGSLQDG